MKRVHRSILTLAVSLLLLTGIAVYGQINRYYSPGTIWTITTIRIKSAVTICFTELNYHCLPEDERGKVLL